MSDSNKPDHEIHITYVDTGEADPSTYPSIAPSRVLDLEVVFMGDIQNSDFEIIPEQGPVDNTLIVWYDRKAKLKNLVVDSSSSIDVWWTKQNAKEEQDNEDNEMIVPEENLSEGTLDLTFDLRTKLSRRSFDDFEGIKSVFMLKRRLGSFEFEPAIGSQFLSETQLSLIYHKHRRFIELTTLPFVNKRHDLRNFLVNHSWNVPADPFFVDNNNVGPIPPGSDEEDMDNHFWDFLRYIRRIRERPSDGIPVSCVLNKNTNNNNQAHPFKTGNANNINAFDRLWTKQYNHLNIQEDIRAEVLREVKWSEQLIEMYAKSMLRRLAFKPDDNCTEEGVTCCEGIENIFTAERMTSYYRGFLQEAKTLKEDHRRREGRHLGRIAPPGPVHITFPRYRRWMMDMKKIYCGKVYDVVADTLGLLDIEQDLPRPLHRRQHKKKKKKDGRAGFYACKRAVSMREAVESYMGREVHRGALPPPPGRVRIALLQTCAKDDKEHNLKTVKRLLDHTSQRPVQMVFIPEAVDYIVKDKRKAVTMAETLEGPLITRFKEYAIQFNVWISIGGFHELLEGTKNEEMDGEPWVSNTHLMINPEGKIVGVYRKAHLFDVDDPENNIRFRESSFIRPGDSLVVVPDTPLGTIGLGICYDLRFPEFATGLRKMGADVLTYPSAFTDVTGAAHWETLLRARAIENQCFVIAAAQTGMHYFGRKSWGHSMIIDPWGVVLTDGGNGVGCVLSEIDVSRLSKMRKAMPVMEHKREGLINLGDIPQEVTTWRFNEPPRNLPEEEEQKTTKNKFWFPSSDEAERELTVPFGHVEVKNKFIFLQNTLAHAFVNRKCVVPGHVLVSTKRVAARLSDLSSEEVTDLFLLVQAVERVMEAVHQVSSSTIAVQDGPEAGQTVKHIHVHVLPRKPADFAENDDVYHELATHDKGAAIVWRVDEDMAKEAEALRTHIQTNHAHLLSPK